MMPSGVLAGAGLGADAAKISISTHTGSLRTIRNVSCPVVVTGRAIGSNYQWVFAESVD